MPRHHNINGVQVPFTAEEEAQRDAEEQAWNEGAFDRAIADLRQRRNSLIASSDWVMMSDSPIADKTAWETYRQSLRDLPNGKDTVAKCENATWPTKP